jgi:hypothetical protein
MSQSCVANTTLLVIPVSPQAKTGTHKHLI